MPNSKKYLKQNNVKAVLAKDGNVIMTSFGKGNAAVIEKNIEGKEIKSLVNPESFSVAYSEKTDRKFVINNSTKTNADNPLSKENKVREDVIHAKEILEKRYFGKTFDDNIHIQLIYNIMDIKKILTVYANNIVYAINNLNREKSGEDDFIGIGYLTLKNDYATYCNPTESTEIIKEDVIKKITTSCEEFKDYYNNPRMIYFASAFYDIVKEEDKKGKTKYYYKEKDEKTIYYMLAILDAVRNSCFHNDELNFEQENVKTDFPSFIYNISSYLPGEARVILDNLYINAIKSLECFSDNSAKKNFRLIFDSLEVNNDIRKKELAKEYYDFTVKKTFKNCGFSVKILREIFINKYKKSLCDKSYDSIRQKINSMIDFFIVDLYMHEQSRGDALITLLRKNANDEVGKADIYDKEIEEFLLAKLKKPVEILISMLEKIKSSDNKANEFELSYDEKKLINDAINNVKISMRGSKFTEVIYLLTLFLDGKEINELLTTLINKFDNIYSLKDILDRVGEKVKFIAPYDFFNGKNIVEELKNLNSIAKMTKIDYGIKKEVYEEAAELLGYVDSDLDEYIESRFLNKESTGMRNFIINNVIKSSRFNYIVRYAQPMEVRKFANNTNVIKFAIKHFDNAELIDRYFYTCTGRKDGSTEDKINYLANLISNLKITDFENVDQSANAESNKDKQQKQAICSFYLLMLYQIVKNLVNINSRYVIAFAKLEHDTCLFERDNNNKMYDAELTGMFIEKGRINFRARTYLEDDIRNTDRICRKNYRNTVAHLNAIRKSAEYCHDIGNITSYFALYHYIVQHALLDKYDKNLKDNKEVKEKTHAYMESVRSCSTYCKDFVKALNAPFGYNLSRFKNLSVEELFDKNDMKNG